MERLLLFFMGHRLLLMTPQTQGITSSGDTLHCSFWSLNSQGFIFTDDENRMFSIVLRRGSILGELLCLLLFWSDYFAQGLVHINFCILGFLGVSESYVKKKVFIGMT